MWVSNCIHHQNDSVTYGKTCVLIHFGEDLQSFILSLIETIKSIKGNKGHKQDLSLNFNDTKISIDTNVNKNAAFVTVKNSSGDVVFTISDLKCVYKLLNIVRDVLPNGAFINKDESSIVFVLIECVRKSEVRDRQFFSDLNEDFITGEILKKDPSLDNFKIRQLLKVNRIDLLCITNLNLPRQRKEPIASNSNSAEKAQNIQEDAAVTNDSNPESKSTSNSSDAQNTVIVTSKDPVLSSVSVQKYQILYTVAQQQQPLTIVQHQPLPTLQQQNLVLTQEQPFPILRQQPVPVLQNHTFSIPQQQSTSYLIEENLSREPPDDAIM